MNPITPRLALEIISHEAIIRETYKDSVGVLTWSVGLTSATGHDVARYIGKPQTLQHCIDVYVWALRNYCRQVDDVFAGYDLTEAQYAAALSFHWNTGAIRKASWVKKFKAGDKAGARASFMSWNKPPEIKSRRAKEAKLLFDGVWSSDGTCIEYTRLTSKMTPVWGSAQRINVRSYLEVAFKTEPVAQPQDLPSRPDAKPVVPTLTPSTQPTGSGMAPMSAWRRFWFWLFR